jgi:formylglycine-generating enzyme
VSPRRAPALLLAAVVVALASESLATVPRTVHKPMSPPDMVFVPATRMSFAFDATTPTATAPSRLIGAFWIDRNEVTVARYQACVRTGGCTVPAAVDTMSSPESPACTWNVPGKERHPLNCVTWMEATTFCHWEGKRLPSEREFEVAAGAADGRRFPWGNTPPTPKLLNACDERCVRDAALLGQTFESLYKGSGPNDDGFGFTAPVGSFPAGASPHGALDMAGNVEEWTADVFFDLGGPPTPPASGGDTPRVVRGGSWDLDTEDSFFIGHRSDVNESQRAVWLGFRCARGA